MWDPRCFAGEVFNQNFWLAINRCEITMFLRSIFWLVVDLLLWKIWKSVGIVLPNMWKNNPNVPNHQPVFDGSISVSHYLSRIPLVPLAESLHVCRVFQAPSPALQGRCPSSHELVKKNIEFDISTIKSHVANNAINHPPVTTKTVVWLPFPVMVSKNGILFTYNIPIILYIYVY